MRSRAARISASWMVRVVGAILTLMVSRWAVGHAGPEAREPMNDSSYRERIKSWYAWLNGEMFPSNNLRFGWLGRFDGLL